jgi:hypothetical protein
MSPVLEISPVLEMSLVLEIGPDIPDKVFAGIGVVRFARNASHSDILQVGHIEFEHSRNWDL